MLVEPLPPIGADPAPARTGPAALERMRIARGWLAQGMLLATRPGAHDPAEAIAGALEQARTAIQEAVEANRDQHAAHPNLHLALDEVRAGIERLAEGAPEAPTTALRHARVADRALDEALATLAPDAGLPELETRPR